MDISIIIPWQDRGDPDRRACAEWIIEHFIAMDIGEVVIGTYPVDDQPLNRSRLRNEGATIASSNMFLFCDADCIITKRNAIAACELAVDGAGAVLPFDTWPTYLTVAQDHAIREAGVDPWSFTGGGNSYYVDGAIPYEWSVGPSYAITREAFYGLNGFDEGYSGWGEEEKDFLCRSRIMFGDLRTIHGDTIHLNYYGVDGRPPQASYIEGSAENLLFQRNMHRFRTLDSRMVKPLPAVGEIHTTFAL